MARTRHDDNAKFGAQKYDRIKTGKSDLFALVDDDDETAWRKSGARTQRHRFVTSQRLIVSAEQRQRARKQLQLLTKEIIQQLGLDSHVSSEAALRIADRVRREKLNSDQQIAVLASEQMPSGRARLARS